MLGHVHCELPSLTCHLYCEIGWVILIAPKRVPWVRVSAFRKVRVIELQRAIWSLTPFDCRRCGRHPVGLPNAGKRARQQALTSASARMRRLDCTGANLKYQPPRKRVKVGSDAAFKYNHLGLGRAFPVSSPHESQRLVRRHGAGLDRGMCWGLLLRPARALKAVGGSANRQ
jgi:hypothetical protein